jgi:valyl-tRNA synthetase
MGRAFVTKLWNATRFILNYPEAEESGELSASDRWILSEFNRTAGEYDRLLERCEFSEAMRLIYGFAWNQFADWYIEIAKAAPSPATPRVLREVFLGTLKLLHPVMPFATEEMAGIMGEDGPLARRKWPKYSTSHENSDDRDVLERTKRCVAEIRSARAALRIEGQITVTLTPVRLGATNVPPVSQTVLETLSNAQMVEDLGGRADYAAVAGDVMVNMKFSGEQLEEQVANLEKEIAKADAEAKRAERKLSNPDFRERAPRTIVEAEEEKLERHQAAADDLRDRLRALKP